MSNEISNPNRVLTKESLSWIWGKIKTALGAKADKSELNNYAALNSSPEFIGQNISIKNNNVDLTESDNDISETAYSGIFMKDKNEDYANFSTLVYPDGNVQAMWGISNYNTSENDYTGMGGMAVTVDKTGDISWLVTGEDSFRNAIDAKGLQEAVSDPTASGNSITFIDTLSQNANGEVTVTKKTVQSASESQSGIITTGEQTFAGAKTFQGSIYQVKAQGQVPLIAVGETGRSLRCYMEVGSGSENHGILSNGYYNATSDVFTSSSKWMIYRDKTGKIIVNGDCTGDCSGSAGSVAWANVTGKVNASASEAGIVSTGAQTFAGIKTFSSFPVFANGANTPGINFRGTNITSNNGIIQLNNSANGSGVYNNPYFSFYEYSPASGGASRTSYYERYDLPAVNTGRTAHGYYSILTTKTTDYVQGTAVTEYIIGSGFVTSNTTSLHLAIQLPKRISRNIQSFSSVKLAIRGISGYVDVFTSNTTERYGTTGYSFSADMRTPYSIEMYITKTSAMTNITNNTPVSVVGSITFKP